MVIPEVLENVDVARALKDEEYRNSLTPEQQQAIAALGEQGELSDEDLEDVAGGSFICDNTIKCTKAL
jgi:mersacidin/lichenicidin family type 2 lantibiotic